MPYIDGAEKRCAEPKRVQRERYCSHMPAVDRARVGDGPYCARFVMQEYAFCPNCAQRLSWGIEAGKA